MRRWKRVRLVTPLLPGKRKPLVAVMAWFALALALVHNTVLVGGESIARLISFSVTLVSVPFCGGMMQLFLTVKHVGVATVRERTDPETVRTAFWLCGLLGLAVTFGGFVLRLVGVPGNEMNTGTMMLGAAWGAYRLNERMVAEERAREKGARNGKESGKPPATAPSPPEGDEKGTPPP